MEPVWNPCRALWNPHRILWNPETLIQPYLTSDHPAALAEPGETLAEFSWKSGGTLVEPYLKPPRTTLQPGTLVEPWRNPRETFLKPAALEEIGGTLVEPSWNLTSNHPRPPHPCRTWWNPGGTLVEPWWNPGGTLVKPWWNPWWNPGGTLAQGRPEPPRSLSGLRPQSFQLLGGKKEEEKKHGGLGVCRLKKRRDPT